MTQKGKLCVHSDLCSWPVGECAEVTSCMSLRLPDAPQRPVTLQRAPADIVGAVARLSKALGHPKEVQALDGQSVEAALIDMAVRKLAQQPTPQPLTADDLREPKNGQQWRVVWWNDSCRMMLPVGMKVDRYKGYRTGTMQFTLKRAHGIKEQS